MYGYRTPGVYFEWLDTRRPGLVPSRTDVAAFVGIAERGELHKPIRVESWNQFTSLFGTHIAEGYLAYAIEGFFGNGGRVCWIVRVADPATAREGHLELLDGAARPTLRLVGTTPGTWSHRMVVRVNRMGGNRFSLTYQLPGGAREEWSDLTLDRADQRYAERVVNDPRTGTRLARVENLGSATLSPDDAPDPTTAPLRTGQGVLSDGDDGLATLAPEHFSGVGSPPERPLGLATLDRIDEVAMVAMPDIMPRPLVREKTKVRPPRCEVIEPDRSCPPVPVVPVAPRKNFGPDQIAALQNKLIGHCERLRDRMAILDCLLDHRTPGEVLAWRSQELLASMFSALYYPWILVPDPLRLDGLLREVPPSGHVAGIWARVDRQTGVHKPPANEVMEGATDLVVPTDDSQHGDLNTEGVNVIRAIPGRGLRVAGARTLSREPDWRYVNVRRLINMIEEAIDEGTQFAVFEPNDRALWRQIDRSARTFLDDLWRRGALDGATAADAYYVRCDESTNPQEETDLGRITCVVGVQPPWPAEFVVVRIGRTETGTEVLEEVGASRG